VWAPHCQRQYFADLVRTVTKSTVNSSSISHLRNGPVPACLDAYFTSHPFQVRADARGPTSSPCRATNPTYTASPLVKAWRCFHIIGSALIWAISGANRSAMAMRPFFKGWCSGSTRRHSADSRVFRRTAPVVIFVEIIEVGGAGPLIRPNQRNLLMVTHPHHVLPFSVHVSVTCSATRVRLRGLVRLAF
jgi:hypothetical protein